MILHELVGTEQHAAYQDLSIDNLERQYSFLRSLVNAAIALSRPMMSTAMIKALNYHAISCLHVNAGEYRPCPVTVGSYTPPDHYRVPELMNEFVNRVNYAWEHADEGALAAFILWQVNLIHPFINGNGRTARALCYYAVCVKAGGMLPVQNGDATLPELIRLNRDEYVQLLQATDAGAEAGKQDFLNDLHAFVVRLLDQQTGSVKSPQTP